MSNPGAGDGAQAVVDRLQDEVSSLRRSRRRLAEAGYADRRAIERDLHDGVQQHLVALAVNLQRLRGLLGGDPDAAQALVDEMRDGVQAALEEATQLAMGIHPPMLEGRGFASAIRSAAARAGVTVAIDVPGAVAAPPEVTAAVYWTCVDALASAPPGSQVALRVHDADDGLRFEVSIDGHLAPDRLEALRDRIEALDGRLSVDAPLDGGSRIQAWLPAFR